MPISLGDAIGGKYAIDFDLTAPFARGYQMGQQKNQQNELKLERQRRAVEKRDQDLLNQIQKVSVFKDIDPVYEKMANDEVSNKIKEVYDLRESGGEENYTEALKKISELNIINAKYNGLTKQFRQARELYNRGLMAPEDVVVFENILRGSDIRNSKGLRDEISGAGVNDDYTVNFGANKSFDVNKAFNIELDNAANQFLNTDNTALRDVYKVKKGIPATRSEAEKIAKATGTEYVRSAEDIAEDLWMNADVRRQLYKDYSRELKQKFGGKGNIIMQDPEAADYLRNRFIEDSKKKAVQSVSFRNIPKAPSSSGSSDSEVISNPTQRTIKIGSTTTSGNVDTRDVTSLYSVSHTPTKNVHQNSTNTFNTQNNNSIPDGVARDIEWGNIDVVPVWKTGKSKGKIVPDSFRDNPNYNNAATIEYKVISFGNYQEKIDDPADEKGASYEQRFAYTPTSEIIGSLTGKGREKYGRSVNKIYEDAQKVARAKNEELLTSFKKNVSNKNVKKPTGKVKVDY